MPLTQVGALGTATLSVVLMRFGADPVDLLASRPLLRLYTRLVPNWLLSGSDSFDMEFTSVKSRDG